MSNGRSEKKSRITAIILMMVILVALLVPSTASAGEWYVEANKPHYGGFLWQQLHGRAWHQYYYDEEVEDAPYYMKVKSQLRIKWAGVFPDYTPWYTFVDSDAEVYNYDYVSKETQYYVGDLLVEDAYVMGFFWIQYTDGGAIYYTTQPGPRMTDP